MKITKFAAERVFPIIGFGLAFIVFSMCVVAPWLGIKSISLLEISAFIGILLMAEGEYDIQQKKYAQDDSCCAKKDRTRYWIIATGWAVTLGLANYFLVRIFYDGLNPMDINDLLLVYVVLLGTGAQRDYRLKRCINKNKFNKKRLWINVSYAIIALCLILTGIFYIYQDQWNLIKFINFNINLVSLGELAETFAMLAGIGITRQILLKRNQQKMEEMVPVITQGENEEKEKEETK